jgi:hypothetical protein
VLDVAEHPSSVRYFSPLCYDFRNQGIKSKFSEGVKQKASKAICVTHTSGKKIDTEKSGPPGEIRTPDTQVRSLVLYPAELRAEWPSLPTGREVYHGFYVVALAYSTILNDRLAAALRGSSNWGLHMNTDRAFVSATLMADENRSVIETRLSTLLEHSLTPMEPGQAKTYMEHTAVRMAEEAGAGVTMFQMVEIKNANSAYLIRVAVLTNGSAIGLDLMDLENGQYFIPETCPIIPLEVPTIN